MRISDWSSDVCSSDLIGSGLTGVMYVLDEPSIGLHQRDNDRLIQTLQHLRDLGNSVIVVEHDEDMIRSADFVLDMGPGAGEHGGRIVAQGTPQELAANEQRSEEHTSELQSLMRISYAVFCLKKKKRTKTKSQTNNTPH